MPKALLVAPENPRNFWSQHVSLEMVEKLSAFPNSGLLTVAGLFPEGWDLRMVDTNVEELLPSHFDGVDVALTSGYIVHKKSTENIIRQANEAGVPILSGGPLATQYCDRVAGFAGFYRGEAEVGFLPALEEIVSRGYRRERKVFDNRGKFAPLGSTPPQRFDLISNPHAYGAMSIQITRGCPEHCTFCDIPELTGNTTRLSPLEKVIKEMDILYSRGWRGPVMLVDDNFAGNREAIMPILKATAAWQKERGYPFSFFTQAALTMCESNEFLEAMYQAGIDDVFIGIESVSPQSLKFMGAQKNLKMISKLSTHKNEDYKEILIKVIQDLQANYFKVMAGFILGFETDPDDIAPQMIDFIQRSRIGVAMVGPLGILPGTPDYQRYSREGRLVPDVMYGGDSGIIGRKLSYIPHNSDGNPIDPNIIFDRHREVLQAINSPKMYFARTEEYLKNRQRSPLAQRPIGSAELQGLKNSLWRQGVTGDYRHEFWKFLWDVTKNRPSDFPSAIGAAIHGHHLISTTEQSLKVDDLHRYIEKVTEGHPDIMERIRSVGSEVHEDILRHYQQIRTDFRELVNREHQKIVEVILNYQLQPV